MTIRLVSPHKTLAGVVLSIVGLTGIAHAQNAPQPFKDWKNTSLSGALRAEPRLQCDAVVRMTTYEFSILSARTISAAASVPQFCRVLGQILPQVRFELSLPAQWNGRLYMFGNGGYAGEALDAPARIGIRNAALQRGFAVVQTNTGHDASVEPLGTFAADSQKLLDYAYRAVHVTAMTAKRIIAAYYEQQARRSYFDGCSTGGRQGLMSAQRFPDDFDGILVGAPVLDITGTMVSYAWNQKQLNANPITVEQLKIVTDAAYGKCDASDGLSDGVIDDPRSCGFRARTDLPICSPGAGGSPCLTSGQIDAVEAIYDGPKSGGTAIGRTWPIGSEISAPFATGSRSGWVPWFLAAQSNARSIQSLFGETFMQYMAFGKPDPAYDWKSFDFDKDPQRMDSVRAILDATNPDLTAFRSRGGKILMYFGWADPALNPLMGVQYYEQVNQRMGSSASDFFRLYMVPGMFHCGGGVGTSVFDAFTPLVEWVEKVTVPSAIRAERHVDGKADRSRPLCPHPQAARYKGAGSTDDAANFACLSPDSLSLTRPPLRSN
jgi:tannase/feruloyl esterase